MSTDTDTTAATPTTATTNTSTAVTAQADQTELTAAEVARREIDAARLAHKRALDRKSQNAKRERTRLRLQTLEQRLALSEESIRQLASDKERLEAENNRLRESLATATPSPSNSNSSDRGVNINISSSGPGPGMSGPSPAPSGTDHGSPVAGQTVPHQNQTSSIFDILSPTTVFRTVQHNPHTQVLPHILAQGVQPALPQHLYQVLPCNSSPICLSDQIMDTFIKSQKTTPTSTYNVEYLREKPNVLSLIMPETSITIPPVLRVASDVLRAFTDIATLPEQVGGLYLMFRLLNWRVFPTLETYREIPEWLRPIPLQLRIPHPAWMDAIPWPRVRALLVSRQDQYHFESWSAFYSSSLSVSWPYNPSDTIVAVSDEEIVASPIFEQHWQNLKNWNVGPSFRKQFPEIGLMVDEYRQE